MRRTFVCVISWTSGARLHRAQLASVESRDASVPSGYTRSWDLQRKAIASESDVAGTLADIKSSTSRIEAACADPRKSMSAWSATKCRPSSVSCRQPFHNSVSKRESSRAHHLGKGRGSPETVKKGRLPACLLSQEFLEPYAPWARGVIEERRQTSCRSCGRATQHPPRPQSWIGSSSNPLRKIRRPTNWE